MHPSTVVLILGVGARPFGFRWRFTGPPTMKIWTAIQHSSGLVAALGLFIAISAYSSDSGSSTISVGLIITGAGLIGFIAGRTAAKRHER